MTSTINKYRLQELTFLSLFLCSIFIYPACESLEKESPLQMTVDHMEYVAEGSYKITGSLVSLGDKEINGYGLCWSESPDPDLGCSYEELDLTPSAGEFSITVSGLSPSTTYYFKAFVRMNSLADYSEEKEFTTRPAAENMVMDVNGNIYPSVKIGDQIWMAENLKATMYADKTPIPLVEDSAQWFDFTRESLGYCWYENVQTHGYVYGALYSWAAATKAFDGISTIEEGVQGVCPDGWHLPSDDEWKALEMYLGMSQEEADIPKWRGRDQGGKMKQEGLQYWNAPNSGASNEIGFNASPGGYRHGSAVFKDVYKTARFWTSTQNGYGYAWYRSYGYAWYRRVEYDRSDVYRDFSGVYRGHSVRCVKDQ
jgi:uncharacterized protein (TIGR02145 family)